MKRYLPLLIAITYASLTQAADEVPASNQKLLGAAKSEFYWDASTYGKCQTGVVEKFTRFKLHDGGKPRSNNQLLIRQDFEIGTGCFEGFDPAKVTVSASPVQLSKDGAKVSPKTLWRFEEMGNAGFIGDYPLHNLYRVVLSGCCGAPDENKYYSLLTGQLVAPASLTKIELADTRALRFVSVEFTCSNGKTAQAVVYYADENGIKQKLPVDRSLDSCAWGTEKVVVTPGKEEDYGTAIFKKRSFDGIKVAVKLCRNYCETPAVTVQAKIDADVMTITGVDDARKPTTR